MNSLRPGELAQVRGRYDQRYERQHSSMYHQGEGGGWGMVPRVKPAARYELVATGVTAHGVGGWGGVHV